MKLEIFYNNKNYLIDFNNYEYEIYKLSNDNTMVFFPIEIWNELKDNEKNIISNTINDDYSVIELLTMDVLTVLIDEDFNINEYMNMVQTVKNDAHEFIFVEKLIR